MSYSRSDKLMLLLTFSVSFFIMLIVCGAVSVRSVEPLVSRCHYRNGNRWNGIVEWNGVSVFSIIFSFGTFLSRSTARDKRFSTKLHRIEADNFRFERQTDGRGYQLTRINMESIASRVHESRVRQQKIPAQFASCFAWRYTITLSAHSQSVHRFWKIDCWIAQLLRCWPCWGVWHVIAQF